MYYISALPDWPLPAGIQIEEKTGLITIDDSVSGGYFGTTYYFNIEAKNDYGRDKQVFTLVVKDLIRRLASASPPSSYLIPISSMPSMGVIQNPLPSTVHPGASGWIANQTGAPEYVLRNDDDKDLYSQDMLYVSGAEYVKYDIMVEFYADGDRYVLREYDNSPCNDHHSTPMSEDEKQAIEDYFKNRGLFIEYDRNSFGPDIETRLDVNTIDDLLDVSVFDYGSMVSAIQGLQEGSLEVGLGDEIGTVVPGSVFSALKDRAAANVGLSLGQEGATMTFMSGSVGTVEAGQRFDFAFSDKAVSETAMKEAAGREATSFTFEFAHNNNLPGFAQFDIVTDIAAGQTVNVYKYDAQSQQFSAIAESVNVAEGGVVTYKNNTMSEYLITTAKIKGAVKSDAYQMNQQTSDQRTNNWLYYAGGGFLIVLIGVAITILARRKRKTAG